MICALSQAWSKASGCNPLIGGSNPSERSKDFYGALAELANALDRKSGDWGSNPRGSTDGNVVLIGKATDWKSAVWKYYFHVEVRVLPFPLTFGSVDLIGKAPGPNPVVRKFLM